MCVYLNQNITSIFTIFLSIFYAVVICESSRSSGGFIVAVYFALFFFVSLWGLEKQKQKKKKRSTQNYFSFHLFFFFFGAFVILFLNLLLMSTRPKFIADIQINELLNIPLVTGRCWVKWYVRDSAKPDARGRTAQIPVRDHKAQWDEHVNLRFRLGIQNKTKLLKEYVVIFDVVWDQNGADKLTLGRVEINLAEYVNKTSNKDVKKTKYLLKNSKINGALALTIGVSQVSGQTDYNV